MMDEMRVAGLAQLGFAAMFLAMCFAIGIAFDARVTVALALLSASAVYLQLGAVIIGMFLTSIALYWLGLVSGIAAGVLALAALF